MPKQEQLSNKELEKKKEIFTKSAPSKKDYREEFKNYKVLEEIELPDPLQGCFLQARESYHRILTIKFPDGKVIPSGHVLKGREKAEDYLERIKEDLLSKED